MPRPAGTRLVCVTVPHSATAQAQNAHLTPSSMEHFAGRPRACVTVTPCAMALVQSVHPTPLSQEEYAGPHDALVMPPRCVIAPALIVRRKLVMYDPTVPNAFGGSATTLTLAPAVITATMSTRY